MCDLENLFLRMLEAQGPLKQGLSDPCVRHHLPTRYGLQKVGVFLLPIVQRSFRNIQKFQPFCCRVRAARGGG